MQQKYLHRQARKCSYSSSFTKHFLRRSSFLRYEVTLKCGIFRSRSKKKKLLLQEP
jgi:hypothetical protein